MEGVDEIQRLQYKINELSDLELNIQNEHSNFEAENASNSLQYIDEMSKLAAKKLALYQRINLLKSTLSLVHPHLIPRPQAFPLPLITTDAAPSQSILPYQMQRQSYVSTQPPSSPAGPATNQPLDNPRQALKIDADLGSKGSHYLEKYPSVVRIRGTSSELWAELKCFVCGANAHMRGKFEYMKGVQGFRAHFQKAHGMNVTDSEILQSCQTRSMFAGEVAALLNGDPHAPRIEKLAGSEFTTETHWADASGDVGIVLSPSSTKVTKTLKARWDKEKRRLDKRPSLKLVFKFKGGVTFPAFPIRNPFQAPDINLFSHLISLEPSTAATFQRMQNSTSTTRTSRANAAKIDIESHFGRDGEKAPKGAETNADAAPEDTEIGCEAPPDVAETDTEAAPIDVDSDSNTSSLSRSPTPEIYHEYCPCTVRGHQCCMKGCRRPKVSPLPSRPLTFSEHNHYKH